MTGFQITSYLLRVVGVNGTDVLNIVFVAVTGIQQTFSDLPWTRVAGFTV